MQLEQILITPAVYQQWVRLAEKTISKLPSPVNPKEIGDEEVEERGDGSLVIFATYKGKRVCEIIVPRKHWAWRFPKN